MIHLEGVKKSYGSRVLFQEVTIDCPARTMTALTGPSGSGKSTLLNCIGGLVDADSGIITVNHAGKNINVRALKEGGRRRYRRDILGYLFQDYALVPEYTAARNVAMALSGVGRGEIAQKATEALERVGLGGYSQRQVHELSGGEQQRVALARILAKNPPVILADEPTGALDAENARLIVGYLRQLAETGSVIVIATHDPMVVAACDHHYDVSSFSA